MLRKILELDGIQELSKNQQKSVNGGKKCKEVPNMDNDSGFWSEAGVEMCDVHCRPSFLGIGFGSWEVEESMVPCS